MLKAILLRLRPSRPIWPLLGWIIFSSAAWALCYPPFPLGPLAFVVLIPAMLATLRLNLKQAFAYHFASGIVYNIIMYWWIYNVMKVGPALVIGFGLILLILFLSLFNALLGWLFGVLARLPYGLLAYPFLWSGLEVLRTRGEMSFPWNDMGYALGNWPVMIQSASWLGVFGLTFVIVVTNVGWLSAFRAWRGGRWALGFASAAVSLLIPLLICAQGLVSLDAPDVAPIATMDISLIQPAIPQTKKWDEHYFQEVMQKTWDTMDSSATSIDGTDLMVLAETAVPDFLKSRDEVIAHFRAKARKTGADIVVGALDAIPDPKPYHAYLFFNSAFLFRGHAPEDTLEQYSKIRLVPFSERLPFDDVFPIINYVNLGEGDFSPGTDIKIWRNRVPYAPSICYEIIYPDLAREMRRRGAQLFVNITNDGWFGYSNAPYQHANIARFRAVETGVPIARCANAGISVFYDYKGRVVSKTKLFQQSVLRCKLPIKVRDTWYLQHGDAVENLLAWIFPFGFLACCVLAIKGKLFG